MLKSFIPSKLHTAILLSIAFTPANTLYAAKINADSNITAVTVYPGSAKITRVSNISLTAGNNEIIINNLPLNLNESSLRVSGEDLSGGSNGSITLGSIELSRDIQEDVVQEQEKNLRIQIEDAQEGRAVIEDSLSRNNSQLQYIKKMVLGNDNRSKKKEENNNASYTNLPLEQWQQAWQTLDQATQTAQEKIRLSKQDLKANDKLLNKLKRQLQQVATNQKEQRSAKIQITSESTTDITLNLKYQINGARWEPVYDIDLNTETGDLKIKTLAQISQRTGENWDGIDITLSTLRPSAGTQLPTLNPWVLDFAPELVNVQAQISSYSSKIAMDTMSERTPREAAPKAMTKLQTPIRQQQSRLISADFSAEYKVPGEISLNSGSNKRRFALSSQQISSTIKLASAPRFDPRAMILATTKYQDETPLLAGSISLYRNGNFVGNSFLQQKLSGEEIKLSFGEDDKVKVKFMPDPDKKRKDGLLFGKKKVVERHYKVSINSNHNKPYPISISDVIPVASDENINVKRLGENPNQSDVDNKKGVISWDKILTPKADLKIQYGYSVSYPEDQQIPGL